jgi:hypothetical protein
VELTEIIMEINDLREFARPRFSLWPEDRTLHGLQTGSKRPKLWQGRFA